MVIDLNEYRLTRQLRSESARQTMPGRCEPAFAAPEPGVMLTWRTVSPSTKLMVDPRNGARAVVRDTRSNAGRFLWNVLPAGEMHPVSEGRTSDLARALSLAEAALRAYAETGRSERI